MSHVTPQFLLALSASMPMKQIDVLDQPYLQRYFAGTYGSVDLWLHRFLSCDGDRHLHNHPWTGTSIVLTGGYQEQFIDSTGERVNRLRPPAGISIEELMKILSSGQAESARQFAQVITPSTWHRIWHVYDQTWTLMIVGHDRLPEWYFKDDAGNIETMKPSPRDWFMVCNNRARTKGAVQ
jgi:hypothetical protein